MNRVHLLVWLKLLHIVSEHNGYRPLLERQYSKGCTRVKLKL